MTTTKYVSDNCDFMGCTDGTGINGAAFGGVADQFHDSAEPITGWFTAYRGDLAIAATAP